MQLTETEIKNYTNILPNGLTVITIEMPHIHTLEVAMFVRAGLRFENEKNNGISHFLEHMMFRGNKVYPDSISLNKEFEKIGRDLRASTLSEYTFYGFSPHVSQLAKGMELFSDFFSHPNFKDIELERQIILEEYLEEVNENGDNIDINNHACKLLYKNTPLAMPTIGTENTIKSIDVNALREYYESYYIPENMILVGAGPLSHSSFFELAAKNYDNIQRGGRQINRDHFINSVKEDQKKPAFSYQHDSDSQIQLQICFRSVSYNHPDYYKAYLINRILDDGVASRLQRGLREKLGLAYSIDCRATSLSDVGTFDFDVTVSKEKIPQIAKAILEEIKKFVEDGPTEEEVDHVKTRYVYDLDFDLDDPYKQILRYGFVKLFSKEISDKEEKQIIKAITPSEILEAAKRIFVRDRLNLIMVGPLTDDLKTELENLANQF
jgi:predicted Zn-dependent peptidase